MSVREELNNLKKHLGITADRELAEKLGTSKNNIDSWVKRGKIPDKWTIIIGQLYNSDSTNIDIPILKLDAGAGDGVYNYDPQQVIVSLNPKFFPFVASGKSAVIEIVGDSMEPELLHGDYILISPVSQDRQKEDGVYAIRVDGSIKVKALQFMLDGTIEIISYNKAYKTEVYNPAESQIDFEILGKKQLRITR